MWVDFISFQLHTQTYIHRRGEMRKNAFSFFNIFHQHQRRIDISFSNFKSFNFTSCIFGWPANLDVKQMCHFAEQRLPLSKIIITIIIVIITLKHFIKRNAQYNLV